MAQIRIYQEENDTYYNVTFDLLSNQLSDGDGAVDYYLSASTDMHYSNGTAFPVFRIRTLYDVPPGDPSPASDFSTLMNSYIEWFMTQAEMGMSSSSSSSSSSTSSASSAGTSSSSSSSSSSSTPSSQSSSSSLGNSSSSSSHGFSSSSSSSSVGSSSSSSENAVYLVSGITSPTNYNGLYWADGTSEGQPCYKNKVGVYLYNDAVLGQQYWFISTERGVGDPSGAYFVTAAAGAIADPYTGYNGATGTVSIITAPH